MLDVSFILDFEGELLKSLNTRYVLYGLSGYFFIHIFFLYVFEVLHFEIKKMECVM